MHIFQVDTFTTQRFSGNPATVILDADGQSDESLAAIAREFPHAETAFVFKAGAADHDFHLRFFNARKEAPFVGHATVAAHAVLLRVGRRGPGISRQRSGTGIIEVTAQPSESDDTAYMEFRQTAPVLEAALPLKDSLRIAQALALPGELIHEHLPARIARKGSVRLLLPVRHEYSLTRIDPHFDQLLALGREFGTEGFFVFSHSRDDRGSSTHSRMFCPALGIPEDPVSGNAHAMLAAYLWNEKQLELGEPHFIGHQGIQLKRPGQVHVALEIQAGSMAAARIGGHAVIISEGRLA